MKLNREQIAGLEPGALDPPANGVHVGITKDLKHNCTNFGVAIGQIVMLNRTIKLKACRVCKGLCDCDQRSLTDLVKRLPAQAEAPIHISFNAEGAKLGFPADELV